MRSPRCFMATSSTTVTGFRSSATGRLRVGRGVQLRQLPEPEVPVRESGMRDRQLRLSHDPVTIADDVQVEGARAPPDAALPAPLRLDGMQVIEQHLGLHAGLEEAQLVPVGYLWLGPE